MGEPLTGWRAEKAAQKLGIVGAVVHIKGDWMKCSSIFGLPNWASKNCPCPFCKTDKAGLFSLPPFDPITSPWTTAHHEDYEAACAEAEIHVSVKRADHDKLLGLLEYDKREQGSRGRALIADYRALGLEAGDKLSPSSSLLDVADFDRAFADPSTTSVSVVFWRPSKATRARWRNPLFDPTIGITVDTLSIDMLHTVFWGSPKISA